MPKTQTTTQRPRIDHHGAHTGVTGSCHQLHLNEHNSLLIDCGLFMGKEAGNRPGGDASQPIDFDISTVQALIATGGDGYQRCLSPGFSATDPGDGARPPSPTQGDNPLVYNNLLTVSSQDEHRRMVNHLAHSARPAIVIAGSGMCTAGRIVNYLKAMLGDERHDVLFVGYQAEGTPGREIQKHGPQQGTVLLDGERYRIRAGVQSIGGYSAHADQQGLVRFVKGIRRRPQDIRLVHGEEGAKLALREALAQ